MKIFIKSIKNLIKGFTVFFIKPREIPKRYEYIKYIIILPIIFAASNIYIRFLSKDDFVGTIILGATFFALVIISIFLLVYLDLRFESNSKNIVESFRSRKRKSNFYFFLHSLVSFGIASATSDYPLFKIFYDLPVLFIIFFFLPLLISAVYFSIRLKSKTTFCLLFLIGIIIKLLLDFFIIFFT